MQTAPGPRRSRRARPAAHALPRRSHRPAPRARERGDPAPLPAGAHRRRALPRRRPAPEHAHRARAPPRRDAHLRHRQLARGRAGASSARRAPARPRARPGAAFLLGKVLNAFLLDHVDVDLELLTAHQQRHRRRHARLRRRLPRGAERARRSKRGAPEYRYVNCLAVRPSEDIGRLASDHLQARPLPRRPDRRRSASSTCSTSASTTEADLASYLLFDGPFCRSSSSWAAPTRKARRDELVEFFGEVRRRAGRHPGRTRRDRPLRSRALASRLTWPSPERVDGRPRLRGRFSGGVVVRSMTVVGTRPPAPPSSTIASPWNAASISCGSTYGSSPGRAAVDEMMGRPSSRARARVASHAGTRMPTCLAPHLHELRHLARRLEDERVRPGQKAPEHPVHLVVDDGVLRDVGEIGADERERVRAVHALDGVETLDGVLAREVAAEAVDRVGRVGDDAAVLQRVYRAPDLARLGVIGVDARAASRRRAAGVPRIFRRSHARLRAAARLAGTPMTPLASMTPRELYLPLAVRLRLGRGVGQLRQRRHLPRPARA